MLNRKNRGFTLIELLTVIAIIALLIGILVPSLQKARTLAKSTAVKAQLDGITKGLEMFHNDFGYYPNSSRENYSSDDTLYVQGAHRLAAAMLGRDLLGCPTQSPDSLNAAYYTDDGSFTGTVETDLSKWGKAPAKKTPRKGTYVQANGLYVSQDKNAPFPKTGNGYIPLLCDKFDQMLGQPILSNPTYSNRNVILYYRANPREDSAYKKVGTDDKVGTYNVADNSIISGTTITGYTSTWDGPLSGNMYNFYWGANVNPDSKECNGGIINSSAIVGDTYPAFNKDTYLLISAGPDGAYFTEDDVVNWNK